MIPPHSGKRHFWRGYTKKGEHIGPHFVTQGVGLLFSRAPGVVQRPGDSPGLTAVLGAFVLPRERIVVNVEKDFTYCQQSLNKI